MAHEEHKPYPKHEKVRRTHPERLTTRSLKPNSQVTSRLRLPLSGFAMPNENPYDPPLTTPPAKFNVVRVFYWRVPFLLVAAIIASIPFYGYFVQAGRNAQQTAVWIMLCWLLNLIFIFGSMVVAVLRPANSRAVRITAVLLIVYMMTAAFIGWGGVGKAIGELLAG